VQQKAPQTEKPAGETATGEKAVSPEKPAANETGANTGESKSTGTVSGEKPKAGQAGEQPSNSANGAKDTGQN
jgi:hypothetical protein